MSLPYFPMFPSDFEAKTSHLTLEEDGAYNRLLRIMWMTPGCSVPDDDRWIMRRMRVDHETYERVVRVVIDEFCDRENGRVSNAKLTEIFEDSVDRHEKRVRAGSKGGKAKALKINKTGSSNAVAKPKQPEPEPEPELLIKDTNVSLSVSTDAPTPANDVSEAVVIYNQAADRRGWPKVQKSTPNRSKQIKARLKDCDGIEGWKIAIEKAEASDFICGRTPKPWTGFGFDWVIKAQNFTKLMEGNYDNRVNNAAQPAQRRENRPDPALERIARLAGLGEAQSNGGA